MQKSVSPKNNKETKKQFSKTNFVENFLSDFVSLLYNQIQVEVLFFSVQQLLVFVLVVVFVVEMVREWMEHPLAPLIVVLNHFVVVGFVAVVVGFVVVVVVSVMMEYLVMLEMFHLMIYYLRMALKLADLNLLKQNQNIELENGKSMY